MKDVYLPTSLFDKILTRSTDMFWSILPELLPCVENMDELSWKDLRCFTDRVPLRTKDVRFICRKRPTMKNLSVKIHSKIRPEDSSSLPLFRLKRLPFDQELERLPLRVDPENPVYSNSLEFLRQNRAMKLSSHARTSDIWSSDMLWTPRPSILGSRSLFLDSFWN